MRELLKHFILIFMLLSIPFHCSSQDKDIVCSYNTQGKSANGEYVVLCNTIDGEGLYTKYVPIKSERVHFSYDNNADFKTAKIELGYHIPSIKSYGSNRLSNKLHGARSPKIIVRLPKECSNERISQYLEDGLSELGFVVIDSNIIGEDRNLSAYKQAGIDMLLDISWLQFSDPEMWTKIDTTAIKIYPINFSDNKVTVASCNSKEDFDKFCNKAIGKRLEFRDFSKYKNVSKKTIPISQMPEFEDMSENGSKFTTEILSELLTSQCFLLNKNVISARFKFVDTSDGSTIAMFHVGHHDLEKIIIEPEEHVFRSWTFGLKGIYNNKFNKWDNGKYYHRSPNNSQIAWIDSWNKERYDKFNGSEFASWTLTNIAIQLNNSEIPHYEKLNNYERVKISDEVITENTSSTSITDRRFSGMGRNYYNRWFNSTYWSGRSDSTTNTSSTTTTTIKEAEYLDPHDFYGYYRPLIKRFIFEIQGMLK